MEKYFLLTVPGGAIPDKVIADTFRSWASASNPPTLIQDAFAEYQRRGDSLKFLDSIVLFLNELDNTIVDSLLAFLSSNIRMFSSKRGGLSRSEYDGALRLVLFLLNDKGRDSDKKNRLDRILQTTPAIQFAITIVSALSGTTAELYQLQTAVDVHAAKEIISRRAQTEIIEAGIDIFQTEPDSALYILFQTGLYDDDSKQMVNGYTLGLCQKHPPYIGKLVGGFLIDFGDAKNFNLNELRRVYDSRALAALARAAGETAWNSNHDQHAIELLLSAEPEPTSS